MVTGRKESKNSMVQIPDTKQSHITMPKIAGVGKGSVWVWNMFVDSAFLLPHPSPPVLENTQGVKKHFPAPYLSMVSSMREGTWLAHLLQNTRLWDNAWRAQHFQYRYMQTVWMDSVLTRCQSNAWVKVPWNLGLRDVGTEKRGCDEEGHVKRMRKAKTRSKLPSKI